MSLLGDGLMGYAMMVVFAALVHEPWRWAGYAVGRSLDPNDEIFKWVKAVSTALVAALATRLLLFPAGALASIPLWLRVLAFLAGMLVFFRTGYTAWKGVCVGAAIIGLGKLVLG